MIGQEWMSGYSTIKTPGVHRAYHLAMLGEHAAIRELATIRELASVRSTPQRVLDDGMEQVGAM